MPVSLVSGDVPIMNSRLKSPGLRPVLSGVSPHIIAKMKPKPLLQVEGGAVLLAACFFYQLLHGGWLWFAVLFLTPDVSMLGYLAGGRIGAMTYNFVHTYTVPIFLLLALWFFGQTSYIWLAVIWVAHIGFDRLLGFGLKYETAFKDTHLNRV